MQLYPKVTKEVDELPEGPQIGAFFDFDGTIIYGYSATKYLREQLRRGDVKPRQLVELVRTMTKFTMGDMGFSAMMTATSGYLKGIEEKEYIAFGEELYQKHIAKLIYPESRALIEAHLKKGHTVALISAATPYQVTAASHDLGIPHVMCTHLETRNGVFTGEVVRPTCYGMGKVAAAKVFETSHGVDPAKSFFYSDSDEDIQLLEHVGNPRPLNPNSRLRQIASGRGWPVQDFNSRGSAGIRDYLRTMATQGTMVTSALAGLPIYALTGSMRKTRNFSTSLFADLATAVAGIELDVSGEEHVWTDRPCVFIFNHQSQADTIILPALLRRDLAGVGKKEIADIPILGKIMEYGGTVLIDRDNTSSALEAMRPLVDVMRKEGRSVCMAPEGTRSTSTNLGRFKKGAFHLALQAGVPIVPIVIHNAIDVAQRGRYVMRPATVKVTVLPPVDTSDWSAETMDAHVDYVRDMFLVELDQMVIQRPEASTTVASIGADGKSPGKLQRTVTAEERRKVRAAKAAARKKAAAKKKAAEKKPATKKAVRKVTNKTASKKTDPVGKTKTVAKKAPIRKRPSKKSVTKKAAAKKAVSRKTASRKSSTTNAQVAGLPASKSKRNSSRRPTQTARLSGRRSAVVKSAPKMSARQLEQQAAESGKSGKSGKNGAKSAASKARTGASRARSKRKSGSAGQSARDA